MTDSRSPLTTRIIEINPHAYEKLVIDHPTPQATKDLLAGVTSDQLLTRPIAKKAADALLAALWLWHDGLQECHHIVQDSPSGELGQTYSYWHAIMHRREGDFSNSKYWYARAAGHPSLATMTASVGAIIDRAPADNALLRTVSTGWNPSAFVDLTEAVSRNNSDARLPIIIQLQQLEWRILWEYCARLA